MCQVSAGLLSQYKKLQLLTPTATNSQSDMLLKKEKRDRNNKVFMVQDEADVIPAHSRDIQHIFMAIRFSWICPIAYQSVNQGKAQPSVLEKYSLE